MSLLCWQKPHFGRHHVSYKTFSDANDLYMNAVVCRRVCYFHTITVYIKKLSGRLYSKTLICFEKWSALMSFNSNTHSSCPADISMYLQKGRQSWTCHQCITSHAQVYTYVMGSFSSLRYTPLYLKENKHIEHPTLWESINCDMLLGNVVDPLIMQLSFSGTTERQTSQKEKRCHRTGHTDTLPSLIGFMFLKIGSFT